MLASISPLGERARGNRWGVTTGFYLAASVAGGATVAAFLGLVGHLIGVDADATVILLAAAVICLGAGALEVAGVRPPGPRRPVNERWLGSLSIASL